MDPLREGLKHEKYVTELIHNIYDAAYSAKDFRTMQFLDWFVKEQGEEETNANDLIKKWNCLVQIRRACICWTMSWRHVPMLLLHWCCKLWGMMV